MFPGNFRQCLLPRDRRDVAGKSVLAVACLAASASSSTMNSTRCLKRTSPVPAYIFAQAEVVAQRVTADSVALPAVVSIDRGLKPSIGAETCESLAASRRRRYCACASRAVLNSGEGRGGFQQRHVRRGEGGEKRSGCSDRGMCRGDPLPASALKLRSPAPHGVHKSAAAASRVNWQEWA